MSDSGHYVTPEQLCIGLYVHLDLSWMDHPFAFGRFKIKNAEQIAELRRLGLARIRIDPARSDCAPLPAATASPPPVAAAPAPAPVPVPPPEDSPAMQAKRERVQRLARLREGIAEVEKTFSRAADKLKAITRVLHSRPEEAVQQGDALVTELLAVVMSEGDTQIHAISPAMGEDVYFHSLNVSVLALTLGRALKLRRDEMHQLGMAGLFHDIGHTEMPDTVLAHREQLNRAEQALFETHPRAGAKIARKLGLPEPVIAAIAQHHERMDGSGYPEGLAGAQLALVTRVVALVNAYDNACNPQNIALAVTPHEALAQLFAKHRGKFDERLLRTLIRTLGVYPPGTLVRLSDDSLGLVLSVNTTHALRPQVLLYDPDIPKEAALILDLEAESKLRIVDGLKPSAVSAEVRSYLNPRQRVSYFVEKKSGPPRR
jgi:putative nucleotidyltransferase with HDIG domain